MFKKTLCLLLCIALCSFVGCKKNPDTLSVDSGSVPQISSEPDRDSYVNPLTGEDNLSKEIAQQRPVAVMVNNISVAQPVQTGLTNADIIYETEVEGKITRLLAVYQDFKSVEKVGSIRSARYDYIDIALGHNAIYIHHGQDNYHAKPHLADVDRIILGTHNGGSRISNGLNTEHTLYGFGDKLWETIKKDGIETVNTENKPWQTFADKETPVKLEFTADTVTVPFSSSYKTTFKYDEKTCKYTRFFNDTERKDYATGESTTVKNVFVLNTDITRYPGCTDGKGHMKADLSSGDGYYFVNGTYSKIKWSKGASENGFKFTNTDGSDLAVNPGNSWVCIADSEDSLPEISSAKADEVKDS